MSTPPIPEALVRYLEQRDAARAEEVAAHFTALTARERALVKEASVMGYVRGTMHPKGQGIPKDGQIIAEVIGACIAFDDLYPTLGTAPEVQR